MSRITHGCGWRYGMALFAVLLGVLVRQALVPLIGLNMPYVTLYPAMIIASVMFGAGPGVAATAIGIVLAEFLFVEPIGRLPLTVSLSVRATIVLASSFYLGHISHSLRRARDEARAEAAAAKRTESALRENQEELRVRVAALQSAANAVVITAPNGVIEWVNRAFNRLTGYTAEQALGKNPRVLNSGHHQSTFYR